MERNQNREERRKYPIIYVLCSKNGSTQTAHNERKIGKRENFLCHIAIECLFFLLSFIISFSIRKTFTDFFSFLEWEHLGQCIDFFNSEALSEIKFRFQEKKPFDIDNGTRLVN